MWKVVLLVSFASVVLQNAAAQGGAESLPFPGFLPSDRVRELGPEGDDQPNDIYAHIPLRRPKLEDDEVVIYPHHFGFELGQDPEHHIYEVHSAKELASLSHKKHGKHGKHAHHHHDHDEHDHDHDHHHHHDKASKDVSSSSKGGSKTLKDVPAPTTPHTHTPHLESNHVTPPPHQPSRPFPNRPPHGAYPPPPPGAYPPPPPPHARPPYPYRPNPGFPPRLPHQG